jgi:hypothetical protein
MSGVLYFVLGVGPAIGHGQVALGLGAIDDAGAGGLRERDTLLR